MDDENPNFSKKEQKSIKKMLGKTERHERTLLRSSRIGDCLRLKKNIRGSTPMIFYPDRKICKNNCGERECPWWKY